MGSFGERFRAARSRLGLTQMQLSARAKVGQTTISKIERGEVEERDVAHRYPLLLAELGLGDAAGTAPPSSPREPAPVEPATQVEDAVGEAFVPGRHRAGDLAPVLAEAASVMEVFGPSSPERSETLRQCAALWLDAAAELWARGIAVTTRTLLAQSTILAIQRKTSG